MPDSPAIEVFFAYSHEDEQLWDKLANHLKPLQREGIISTWYDRDISAGSEWENAIDIHLNSAQIILLLISADFMASDYCYGVEMNKAMERHQGNEAIVIPIILRPVYWQITKFSQLQALPEDGKPVITWKHQDEAFLDIVQGIKNVTQSLNNQPIVEVKNREQVTENSEETLTEFVVEKDINNKSYPVCQPQLITDYLSSLPNHLTSVTHQQFQFPVITVNNQGKEINRVTKTAAYFTEYLGRGINLEMVYIPGGTFMMGTEDEEIERLVNKYKSNRFRREQPIHQVTVKPFYMGKFQVTQAQWQEVADWGKIDKELKLNPSYLQGNNLPVETVSWFDAVEFCQRLSKKTGREYRLPSEAQWEYACRAGTTAPFHFGETITGKLANYRASEIFAQELKGEYRRKTTSVGTFTPNNFGLYDMHGNVWEWCADSWHENYQGTPNDDGVWEVNGNSNFHVVRGGSWGRFPDYCRSAYRGDTIRRVDFSYTLGFRVVCVAART